MSQSPASDALISHRATHVTLQHTGGYQGTAGNVLQSISGHIQYVGNKEGEA